MKILKLPVITTKHNNKKKLHPKLILKNKKDLECFQVSQTILKQYHHLKLLVIPNLPASKHRSKWQFLNRTLETTVNDDGTLPLWIWLFRREDQIFILKISSFVGFLKKSSLINFLHAQHYFYIPKQLFIAISNSLFQQHSQQYTKLSHLLNK